MEVITPDTAPTLQITILKSKSITSPKIGNGGVKVCALGGENIVQKTVGNFIISSTDNVNDGTYTELDVTNNISDNVKILCIRGSPNFVIYEDSVQGDQRYAAMFGNRGGNIGNRYHSVNKLSGDLAGYKVQNVSWSLTGYTVAVNSGSNQKFQSIVLDGPHLVYTGGLIPPTQVSLTVSALGESVADPIKFNLEIIAFDPKVVVEVKSATSKPTKGTTNLSDLVNITGPVFNAGLDQGDLKLNVTANAAIPANTAYVPVFEKNLIPPVFIKNDRTGRNIGYGPIGPNGGVNVYIYKNVITIDKKFILPDLKLNTFNSIDCVNTEDVTYGVFGTVKGGQNQLVLFVKDNDHPDPFTQVIEGIDFFATDIRIVRISGDVALALLIDDVNHKAISMTIEPKFDGSKWNIEISNGELFKDCRSSNSSFFCIFRH